MKNIILCSAFVFAFTVCAVRGGDNQAPLVVHEWGTFTTLQDEQGHGIGGINNDDEPVPVFVHRLGFNVIAQQRTIEEAQAGRIDEINENESQIGGPMPQVVRCDTDVLARLETPVIYFYPPAGWKAQPVDVHVSFPGGWITEYFPDAVPKAPGYAWNSLEFIGHLSSESTGELTWSGLVIGGDGKTPDTTSKVWVAPRAVNATQVAATNGEAEKFLFYRGVANRNAALRIARNSHDDLQVSDYIPQHGTAKPAGIPAPRIDAAWLVDVRADGVCAYKSIGPIKPSSGVRATLPSSFPAGAYSGGRLAALRAEMHTALVKQGLFADEADALLSTWQLSYFQSPGLRLFYLCPPSQIDSTLPLDVSVPSRVTRVMVGRIEIVTARQRALLKDIASCGAADRQAKDYNDLGRFRNALVLDEQKRRPSVSLDDFISRNDLAAYKTADSDPAQSVKQQPANPQTNP